MSSWTYINGSILVNVTGRTQPEKEYILKTVLSHMPKVTGSERDMTVYINQIEGYDSSSNCDEFGEFSNLGGENFRDFKTQSNYIISVNASLRDRRFKQTLQEFNKWICRLSKRIMVDDIIVKVSEYDKYYLFQNKEALNDMYEWKDKWTDYLMWQEE